jgi:hypothetical protein
MAYYIDLFSPETYEAFKRSKQDVSGFRPRQKHIAPRIMPCDKLVCYLTKLSRWFGVLEVLDGPFVDNTPIFYPDQDPFTIRFHVRPLTLLDVVNAIPIHDQQIWQSLSFTRTLEPTSVVWTGKVRASLKQLEEEDGRILEEALRTQVSAKKEYEIDAVEYRRLVTHTVKRTDKTVTVSIPDDVDGKEHVAVELEGDVRESTQIQALLAEIGDRMGMSIWIPKADRGGVLREWGSDHKPILERLPLNYDDTTLRTIEQIDVLWLHGRSIVRAFEVEHTTSVYSGILRMADLLALQPNMDIKLHIVAPTSKYDKVFQEIRRPVFSLLERGPLSEMCTYLSYESLRELAAEKHLTHLSDSVLDEYTEEAD